MSIMFDKGDGTKDIRERSGWLKDSHDHLKTEVVAIRLIQNAARALTPNTIVEVRIWCSAALGVDGSGVLYVYKGLHTMGGYGPNDLHLTMGLKIPGSKQHSLVDYSLFSGAFHLKTNIVGSPSSKSGYRIKPVELSYQVVPNPGTSNHIKISIPDAGGVSSELTP